MLFFSLFPKRKKKNITGSTHTHTPASLLPPQRVQRVIGVGSRSWERERLCGSGPIYRKIHTIEMKSRSSHDPVKSGFRVYAISLLSSTKFKMCWGCEKQRCTQPNRMSRAELLVVDTKQKFPGNTQNDASNTDRKREKKSNEKTMLIDKPVLSQRTRHTLTAKSMEKE